MPVADSTPVVPDGIVETRESVRSGGGRRAVLGAAAVAAVGLVLIALPGWPLGAIGFLLVVMAAPALPVVGVPAVSGPVVYAIGAVGSAVAWWIVGSIAGRRAAKRAVADWTDWRRELLPFALGISLGGVVALVLGTIVLGTF